MTLWERAWERVSRQMYAGRSLDPNSDVWSDSERAPRVAAMLVRDSWVAGYRAALKDAKESRHER